MPARLNIARALLNKPRLLFVDEPTTGLDPVNARIVMKTIRELRDQAAGNSAVLLLIIRMPDRDAVHGTFGQAANRAAHDREQLAKTLSEEARKQIADMMETARIERENKEREQKQRYGEDVEKAKARIRDRQRPTHRPE